MAVPAGGFVPNPPDPVNPDPQTLREQWRYATRTYAKYYSNAWGSALLAGFFFFSLGWYIKGGNPTSGGSSSPKKKK
ncbi:uncharacterized protein LOC112347649 [Selaginella moellendorffii]|uniref:uncharacterized protein LOC112347649 n=1 Tax=Selaginella moellendorffii TaxID=88036 RepID=UPI000D1C9944|nr:uncharacterized protein LOC112347649 [Selaginella moellendorffii]|eukprot:XP_024534633.1 uncharacterized protein LOC112347649 [Selaginella moellendorffii]